MSESAIQTFDFIINRSAGGVLSAGEDAVCAGIAKGFGDKTGDFLFIDGADVATTVRAWTDAHAGENRGLVIGGGDGTLISAVEQVLGRNDITLGVLPLGTQNLVARQLGFLPDFKKAAAQYRAGASVDMDIGVVNGLHFLVAIAFDRNSVRLFEAREEMRGKKILRALTKAFNAVKGVLGARKEAFSILSARSGADRLREGRAFIITNNALNPRDLSRISHEGGVIKNMIARMLAKGRDGTGMLALYTFRGGIFRTAALLPRLVRGTWTKAPSITAESASHFKIHSSSGDVDAISLILDGEIKKTMLPLNVSIMPRALRIFKPA